MSLLLTTVSLAIVNAYRMNGFWCSMLSICKKSGETSLARFLWCPHPVFMGLFPIPFLPSPYPDGALTLSLSIHRQSQIGSPHGGRRHFGCLLCYANLHSPTGRGNSCYTILYIFKDWIDIAGVPSPRGRGTG